MGDLVVVFVVDFDVVFFAAGFAAVVLVGLVDTLVAFVDGLVDLADALGADTLVGFAEALAVVTLVDFADAFVEEGFLDFLDAFALFLRNSWASATSSISALRSRAAVARRREEER